LIRCASSVLLKKALITSTYVVSAYMENHNCCLMG
jgi:hypothetical protein